MLIKPLDNPREFDVFLGHGWENWVRVRLADNNRLSVVKTSIDELEPSTLRLILFKVIKLRKKAA